MDTNILIQRINLLPDNLQQQILDYIEFLVSKYSLDDVEITQQDEITDEFKEFLDKRIASYENNPEKVKTWEEIETRLLKKYNYAI